MKKELNWEGTERVTFYGLFFVDSRTVDNMWDAVDRPDNVTQVVSQILKNYDIRLRPNFGGNMNMIHVVFYWISRNSLSWGEMRFLIFFLVFLGDPLYIGMELTIASFDSISEVNMVRMISKREE